MCAHFFHFSNILVEILEPKFGTEICLAGQQILQDRLVFVLNQQEIVGVALAQVRHRLEPALFVDVEKMVAKPLDHLFDFATIIS